MSYDRTVRWYHPAGVILALLLGLGLGRVWAPRYQAQEGSLEARLKARAVEFYQAGRLFNALKMRQLFTPVRQTEDFEQLKLDAAQLRSYWDDLDEAAREEQQKSAALVTPECIEADVYSGEGWGWAVTYGTAPLLVEGREISQQLDRVYWVLTDGDWWIYERTAVELNTYGNPPDPILKELQLGLNRRNPSAVQLNQTAEPAAAAPPAAEASEDNGEPGA